LFGQPFLTWRGLQLFGCDKLHVDGEKKPKEHGGAPTFCSCASANGSRGVVGLFQPDCRVNKLLDYGAFMGINNKSLASYLVSLYWFGSRAYNDAIAVLENVEVGNYHDNK